MSANKKNYKSPFKEANEFKNEIVTFLKKHNSTIFSHATRISDYFEMSCFNYIVQYYEDIGCEVNVKNLIKNSYRYKCSTQGVQSNFSYFEIKRKSDTEEEYFEVHHNLAVQSHFENDIYTTPDIVVINKDSVEEDDDFYLSKKRFCFVRNENMQTFMEVKQFNPFPELLFNFLGTVNELKDISIVFDEDYEETIHLAPTLMISGKSNSHTEKIRLSLMERYNINIVYDLFGYGLDGAIHLIVKNVKKMFAPKYVPKFIDEEDLPF